MDDSSKTTNSTEKQQKLVKLTSARPKGTLFHNFALNICLHGMIAVGYNAWTELLV